MPSRYIVLCARDFWRHYYYIFNNTMATTTEDLREVLKETLENRGVMEQLRARIRAEIFNALDDKTESKPVLSHENLLLNELIREYLDFNMYRYTSSVFLQEAGQPKEPLARDFLAHELHITQDTSATSVPLLYGMLHHFMSAKKSDGEGTMTVGKMCEHGDGPQHLQDSDMQPVIVKGGK